MPSSTETAIPVSSGLRCRHVLVASHGTDGARAAERTALELCLPGGLLRHLHVVPDFWKGMMGDDWLNNVATRITYGNYVEGELAREVADHVAGLADRAKAAGLRYADEVMVGKPAECLLAAIRCHPPDLVVVGTPRPKGEPGLRSRLDLAVLAAGLAVPLLVVPRA